MMVAIYKTIHFKSNIMKVSESLEECYFINFNLLENLKTRKV